jgi:hypothetical protein
VTKGDARHRRVLQEATERHVNSWIRHKAVRAVVETDPVNWRWVAQAALDPLESIVGQVNQVGVCWLMFRALNAQWDAPGHPGYESPEWADRPEVAGVANDLLVVVDRLGRTLQERGVKLDIEARAKTDRLVLAQLLHCVVDWDAPDLVSQLNVGSVRWRELMDGGVYVGSDKHGGEVEDKAIAALARSLRGQIRSYREREGMYDARIRAVDLGPQMSDGAVLEALIHDGTAGAADKVPDLSLVNKRRKQLRQGTP